MARNSIENGQDPQHALCRVNSSRLKVSPKKGGISMKQGRGPLPSRMRLKAYPLTRDCEGAGVGGLRTALSTVLL